MKYATPFLTGLLLGALAMVVFADTPGDFLGAPASQATFQKNLIPITDSTYTLGTTSKTWLNVYTDEICLAGSCQTSWSAGSGEQSDWQQSGGYLVPTTTIGINISAPSVFTYASTTAITVSGNSWLTFASSTSLTLSGNAWLTYASSTGISGTNLSFTNATSTNHTVTGYFNTSDATTVKYDTSRTFTWPGSATTTTATNTVPLGSAILGPETWNEAECRATSGSIPLVFTDTGTNDMNPRTATTTVGRFALSTNNTFTKSEQIAVEIGPITNAQLTCSVALTRTIE